MTTPVLHITQFQDEKLLNGIYVNDFANHICINKELINTPHSHNFYLCVLFTDGYGTHEIDFDSYDVSPGKVFFLKPGQTHHWEFTSPPQGVIFFHSQEFYELQFLDHKLNSFPFFYSVQNPPVLDLSRDRLKHFKKIFAELYQEYKESTLYRELKIVNQISNVYIDLTRVYTNLDAVVSHHPLNYLKILETLERLITENFKTEKLPQFYSDKLNITTKHLNRVVKETINKTTGQLISERVILEAKRLIVHTEQSLSNVAEHLDFSDYAYFSKVFKSRTGVTPIHFRKKYKTNG